MKYSVSDMQGKEGRGNVSRCKGFVLNVDVLFRPYTNFIQWDGDTSPAIWYKSFACLNYLYRVSMTVSSLLKWMSDRNRQWKI